MNVVMEKIGTLSALEKEWTDLETRADASFFISWVWIGTWLHTLPGDIETYFIRVTSNGRTLALTILVRNQIRRHWFIGSNALFLNSTGDPGYDEITIEYNSILAEKSLENDCYKAILEFLGQANKSYDEIYLDGCIKSPPESSIAKGRSELIVRDYQEYHFVDLESLRKKNVEYIDQLSSNTRQQIRRSIRAYEKVGKVRIDVADTHEDARKYLQGLQELHQTYWEDKGEPGSFSNKYFLLFHESLVTRRFDPEYIQLMKISAGEQQIGFLYNFKYRGHVYNYQSGFNYNVADRLNKPGLVSHYLAVIHNTKSGENIYDFMAGALQYKKSLGTHSDRMAWIVIQKKHTRFMVESFLKSTKRSFKRYWRKFRGVMMSHRRSSGTKKA